MNEPLPPAVPSHEEPPPLAGVRVLDLTRLLPGPFATLHLRRMGADVLKIEDPGAGDYARELLRSPQRREAGEPSLFFALLNEGKRTLRLDLSQPGGREELLALAREADVLVEGFRPGVMERLGVGWETLRRENPRLVMASISGYGQAGPWAHRAGHDLNYIAQSGVLEQIATREGRPVIPNFQIGDLFGGTQAALAGLLAALFAAQRSGRGRQVDVSMTHELHAHNLLARLAVLEEGRTPAHGLGLLTGGVPCYQVYATRDGRWMAVGALELKFWRAACEVLGRPEWGERHWSLGQEIGGADALALQDEVAAVFATQTLAEWTERFEPVDCCVTPVLRMDEAMRHPLFAAAPG
ncbi:CaiB/BaiF CoA transferase family protein [Caldimonas tepidiphila]|uniref:CaiB/BaiF CoA transferase family protein n=1 Tax=Caldimonas tepidiphila TaxID=2315841 RepID=UPI000E5BC842|nr:CaiB/BaiF CoA-transferase family protein [Caldimonas tepidiphila]